MSKEKLYEYKNFKSDGARIHCVRMQGETHWKLHNWDGPAINPVRKDSPHKKEYHINGIPFSEDDYKETISQQEGLPFYKAAGFKDVRF